MNCKQYIILAISISTPLLCNAGFTGFPLADGTNYSWSAINAEHAPISQLYSGIVERCDAVAVALPVWSQALYIDNSATGTVETLIVTNALGPVAYTNAYTNGLAYPAVSHNMLAALDDTLDLLIPKFADTNAYLTPTSDGGVYTKAALFSQINVGLVYTNVVTVGTDQVTNVVARWTRSPERRWAENLIEMHYATNGWQLISAEPVEWWHASAPTGAVQSVSAITSAPLPYVAYGPTSSTWSVSLAGVDLYGSNRTETVAVGSECTVNWHSITGTPTVTGFTGSTTGAWFAVQYTNNAVVYGERPYRLYAADLDERWKVLQTLTRTVSVNWYSSNYYYQGREFYETEWSAIKAGAVADYKISGGPTYLFLGFQDRLMWSTLEWEHDVSFYDRNARVEGSYIQPYQPGLSTNTAKNVEFVVYLDGDPSKIIGELGYTNVIEFGDFDTGYTTGRWHTVYTESNSVAARVDSPAWFPADPGTLSSPWHSQNPPAKNTIHHKTIGNVPAHGFKVLLDWDFQYR